MALTKKRLRQLKAIPDSKIDYSDIPETDAEFWKHAKLVMPEPKQGVYLRIDPEVLSWFRKNGRGYQTRINAVLRSYVAAATRTEQTASSTRRARTKPARRG